MRRKTTYKTATVNELQLMVRDNPVVPVELQPFVGRAYENSSIVANAFAGLRHLPQECFLVVHLNARSRMVGMTTVSIGNLSNSLVHPREVFRAAILNLTSGILVIHNHPSGDPAPSAEDREITKRLRDAGKLLGIPLIDHVIIAGSQYYSFLDHQE